MSEKHDKVMRGLEKMADAEGYALEVIVHRPENEWYILFKAGEAQVTTRLISFVRVPQIVVEPFGEELIKQINK